MTTAEQINRYERILHALKGKCTSLKNQRWIDHNYKGQQTDYDPAIVQTEQEITEHRKTLKSLYETI